MIISPASPLIIVFFPRSFLKDVPINDINSVNKTILNINQKLFVNLNIRKL